MVLDAGALPAEEGVELAVPPEAGGAGAEVVAGDGEAAAEPPDDSVDAVVVAAGAGFAVSPVGGFILSE